MIRNYTNRKIYRNFKVVKTLSIIALIMAIVVIIIYTTERYVKNPDSGIDMNQIMFYLAVILIPLIPLGASMHPKGQKYHGKIRGETRYNNDCNNLLIKVIFTFIPYIALIPICIVFVCSGYRYANPGVWAHFCGFILPSHLFVYISDVFLIQNYELIKQEWKENPPDFLIEQQSQEEQIKQEQTLAKCQKLIEKCGIKFFIRYYKQIKRLPLRDIEIAENYTSDEREERLTAAKKIIDSNLSELALNEILKTYGDVLDDSEIEQAKEILEEIQTTD